MSTAPDPPARPAAEARAAYARFRRLDTRWMDNEAYGHLNNVVYYSLFDTAVNATLIEAGALDIHRGEVIGLVVEAGLRVASVGRSSVRYEIGLSVPASR